MPKKPPVDKKDPRLAARGQEVWLPDLQRTEVVRDVVVVLNLANGESRPYIVGEDEIEVVPPLPPPDEKDLPEPIAIPDEQTEGE